MGPRVAKDRGLEVRDFPALGLGFLFHLLGPQRGSSKKLPTGCCLVRGLRMWCPSVSLRHWHRFKQLGEFLGQEHILGDADPAMVLWCGPKPLHCRRIR